VFPGARTPSGDRYTGNVEQKAIFAALQASRLRVNVALERRNWKIFLCRYNHLPSGTKKVVDSCTKNYTPARQSKPTIINE